MTTCLNGHENAEGQRFCGECGAAISPPTMISEDAPPIDAPPIDVEPSGPGRRGSRRKWLAIGLVGLVVLAGLGVAALTLLGGGSSLESRYLKALDEAGLRSEFPADRAAVRNATRVCDALDAGGKAQGSDADQVGVEFYCKDYAKAFHVVQSIDVHGDFTLRDFDSARNGSSTHCSGTGGYSDIDAGVSVIVRNGDGDAVGRSKLLQGEPDGITACVFKFDITLTEGEDEYIVEIGHRGEISFEWSAIKETGLHLSLGD